MIRRRCNDTCNLAPTPATNTTGPSFLRPSGSLPQGTYETQQTGTSVILTPPPSPLAQGHSAVLSLHCRQIGKGISQSQHATRCPRGSRTDTVRVKKGFDAGQQVSILKLILADNQVAVCKVTAWIDTADAWCGVGPSPRLNQGDIVYFESTLSIPCDFSPIRMFSCMFI
ncbi:hypothetical protein JVT61DRAFT_14803 [Boletus reticuloceps]|uniref:Uncharacterized protein n=1 Tax=Boletus reticuloceps TaxID=495285 RepID=A0A8I3AD47_9AGAM|nr:hypothetical protein JVT61DRAFT_14803 [Boletus reticuloceps]